MSTWQQRLKAVVGNRGYENCMRRSLQTVILYEAMRCVKSRLLELRPFQRKAAYMDQCHALIESLDFLYPHQKAEILWRTASSKEQMDPDIAWKREKGIHKELEKLSAKIKPFMEKEAKTHQEMVDLLVQDLYNNLTGAKDKPFPLNWEHAHNHVIMCFRLYYHGDAFDLNFPAPVSPREIIIPTERPTGKPKLKAGGARGPVSMTTGARDDHEPHLDVHELLGENKDAEKRVSKLQEVRMHLDLLKEFEGLISEEELARRKRELYAAMPGPPPPQSPMKKQKADAL